MPESVSGDPTNGIGSRGGIGRVGVINEGLARENDRNEGCGEVGWVGR